MRILQFVLLLEARTLKIAESHTNASNYINQILGNDIKSKDTHIPNLLSISVALESLPILYDLSMALITAGDDGQFITSDTPVCRYNLMYVLRGYTLKSYGLCNVGAQFFLPISPKHCLYLFDPEAYGVTNDIVGIGQHDINELNKLFYLNSYQFLFFNPYISQKYIQDLSPDLAHKNNVKDEITRFGDLIIRSQNHVKDLIKLSFITLNKKTISMALPAHMAGPVRPHAEKAMEEIDRERKKNQKERTP